MAKRDFIKVVLDSILYLFGLGENPLSKSSRIKYHTDYEAIQSDWKKIMN